MNEIWREITNYEGLYYVSSMGRVKSLEKKIQQLDRGTLCITIRKERILKPEVAWNKRMRVTLSNNKKKERVSVHRLVAYAFVPNKANKPDINHKDGNPQNNTADNLEWCTKQENAHHAVVNGLWKSGEDSPRAKLTQIQVGEIREKFFSRAYTQKQLSKEYEVHQTTISKLLLEETYKKGLVRVPNL